MTDDLVEAAFRRASAALDEAWQAVRDSRQFGPQLLIDGGAATDVALMIYRLIPTLTGPKDRYALHVITHACLVDRAINESAYHRILMDIGK